MQNARIGKTTTIDGEVLYPIILKYKDYPDKIVDYTRSKFTARVESEIRDLNRYREEVAYNISLMYTLALLSPFQKKPKNINEIFDTIVKNLEAERWKKINRVDRSKIGFFIEEAKRLKNAL